MIIREPIQLDNLPNLIAEAAKTYGLSNLKLVKILNYNHVLSGFQGSRPIILKLGLDRDGLKREAEALMAFSRLGVVQVFLVTNALLLLECAVPGVSLKSHFPQNDDEAIYITANIIKRLHKAPIPRTHTFPNIKDWLQALDQDCNIRVSSLKKARQLRDNLLETSTKEVLLHGDLHHDNILQNGNDWVVIDPKGVIGEPAYEVAAFIRNPIPELLAHENAPNIIHNRIDRFTQMLELPSQRILDWCFVQAVLAWAWAIEDGDDETYFKNLTEFFEKYIDVQS